MFTSLMLIQKLNPSDSMQAWMQSMGSLSLPSMFHPTWVTTQDLAQPTAIVLTLTKLTFPWKRYGERGTNQLMQEGDAGSLLVQNSAQSKLLKIMYRQIF